MSRNIRRCLYVAIPMVIAIAGCQRSRESDKSSFTIALAGPAEGHPVWAAVQAGAQSYVNENPLLDSMVFRAEADTPEAQKAMIDDLIADRSVKAVMLWPERPSHAVAGIDALVGRGCPVVTVGVDAPTSSRTAYVGFNEIEVGKALASLADRHIRSGRTVMVLHAGGVEQHWRYRWEALQLSLADYSRLEVLATMDCGGSPTVARTQISERLAKYPNLSGWILVGDWPLRGVESPHAMFPAGCTVLTCHVGPAYWPMFDAPAGAIAVAGDYFEWGRHAVRLLTVELMGDPLKRSLFEKPVEIVSHDNVNQWRHRWAQWTADDGNRPTDHPR